MKIIEGIKYYSSREVGEIIGRSTQTVVNWDKYSVELEEQGKERLIPKPLLFGKGNHRYWNKKQIEIMEHFRDNIGFGEMAVFNRRLWSKQDD